MNTSPATRNRRLVFAWTAVSIAAATLTGLPATHADLPTYALEFVAEGYPAAINDLGEIVGTRYDGPNRAWFVDQAGVAVDLPVPGGALETAASDINNDRIIVGTATFDGGTPRACVWTQAEGEWTVELLEGPDVSLGSYGTAVNDLGEIVGTNIGTLGSHPFLFTGPDAPADLYTLGLTQNEPPKINNARQVAVGQLVLDLNDLSVLDIGVPSGSYLWSSAVAINDAGQIAARSVTASGSFYPTATKFDPETGWQVLSGPASGNTAADINNHGDTLIFIQSSWGQQPYLLLDGGGAARVQTLLEPGLEMWFIENVGALAMNDQLQLAVPVSHFQTGAYGTARLTPLVDPADLDGDGIVGPADLALLLSNWGDCPSGDDCVGDLDGDDVVGPADLAVLLGMWT